MDIAFCGLGEFLRILRDRIDIKASQINHFDQMEYGSVDR